MSTSITKQDVKQIVIEAIQENNKILITYMKNEFLKVYEILAEHDQRFDTLKNDIYQFKDDILTEIKDLRDDVTVTTGYRDMIENHETRIVKLEQNIVSNKN